ncbi:MAG TPA: hypothetical protein VLT62_11995 [Candidatus Methylomirabilis sp.]|nr:hypothetical protein [Candidatus Methylomirabilis sp.]
MPTIVEYTQRKRPRNSYPEWMVSPTSAGPCCQGGMEPVGVPEPDGQWIFEYRRCRVCGFTVRAYLRYVLDDAELADLRKSLQACRLSDYPE